MMMKANKMFLIQIVNIETHNGVNEEKIQG